jgi:hypothetical protein
MNTKFYVTITAAILLLTFHTRCEGQEKWISLFDGSSLDGWTQHSGSAKYWVEDGAIVGQAVPNSPNSFLCTQREFSDFILEFEVYLDDPELNSGVQFRSLIAEQDRLLWFRNQQGEYQPQRIPADRVYGYQVEIASEEVGASGGVYDEARRAMMPWWPEKGSEESKAFKNDQWNAYQVMCKGDTVRTTVNGIVVSAFRDALSLKGIIGLQVHGVGDDPTPYKVRWRNIRIQEL